MYIVFDKKSNSIIHINKQPLIENFTDKEVYFYFDEIKHYIVKSDLDYIPNAYKIEDNYMIKISEKNEYAKINENNDVVSLYISKEKKEMDDILINTNTDIISINNLFDEEFNPLFTLINNKPILK